MQERLDYNDFGGYFGMWAEKFRPFIESKEMYDIYQKLKADASKEVIVPSSDDTFKVFGMSSPEQIKSIWYLMDPYPKRYRKSKLNQATGIAMDCSNTPDGKLQPSLEIFYDALDKDLKIEVERSPSLEYLVHQGIMMINTDLTCKLNKTGSHSRLWEPFQKFFLQEIMTSYPGIIYVLAGEASHRMERYIYPVSNYIIKTTHPMAAGHKNMDWDCKGIFSLTNKLLKENRNETVYWDRAEYERYNEPPF